jgi:DNA repair protein RadD
MSQVSLRDYQTAAKQSVLDYWAAGGGNPLIDMATGLGKSVTLASLTREVLDAYPGLRVLMLVHVAELVLQNSQALLRLWPSAPVGIYSAGLGRRDTSQRIIFASIQSVYRRAKELGAFDLVLIDEAHLVPSAGEGMYRHLLDALREMRPDLRVAGFTATPFRMDTGRLDDGKDRLFDEIVFSYGIGKGIDDGWLSPLVSKSGATEIDVSMVAKRGGEFVSGALEAAADDDVVRFVPVRVGDDEGYLAGGAATLDAGMDDGDDSAFYSSVHDGVAGFDLRGCFRVWHGGLLFGEGDTGVAPAVVMGLCDEDGAAGAVGGVADGKG